MSLRPAIHGRWQGRYWLGSLYFLDLLGILRAHYQRLSLSLFKVTGCHRGLGIRFAMSSLTVADRETSAASTNKKYNMKKTTLISLLSLPTVAIAGESTYVQPNQPIAPTLQPTNNWFVGGSAGFLVDAEDEFYSLQIGKELGTLGNWHQSVFLDIGYSELKNDGDELSLEESFNISPGDSFTGDSNLEATFIPITLNYKLEKPLTNSLNFYMGIGAGIALIDVDGRFNDTVNKIDDAGNDSETTFFAQAFMGLTYNVSDHVEIFGGARYMFIDDYSLTTNGGAKIEVDDNDDVLIELGVRYNF